MQTMKFIYKLVIVSIGLILSLSLKAQVNIYNLGSEILINKNTILTINGNLQNEDSTFYNMGVITISGDIVNNAHHLFPDDNNGTVIFTGDSVQYIRGTGNTVWFNILRTQSTDTIKLQLPINVFDSLSMEGGYILLNGRELNLDNSSSIHAMGFLHGESNSSKIIGDTGYIKVEYLALQPASQNLAGIGVSMSSSGNFGATTIKRYQQQQQILDESIDKVFTFDFSNNNTSNVHIEYVDNDYNPDSLKESDFVIWKSTDLGSNWAKMGGTVNTSSNFVDVFGISMEDSWLTVAPKNCRDVPPLDLGGDSTMICVGDTAVLIAGDHLNGYTYQWQDGSTDSSFSTTEQGIYYVKVTNQKGCYSIDTTVVINYPEPHASFTVDNICEKDSTWFQNQSYVIGDLIVGFHWDFGNGDTSNLITAFVVFDTAATYPVNLEAITYSGCTDDTTVNLTAYARPEVGFWDTIVCDNFEITFHDTSTIVNPYGIMSRSWTFDNGVVSSAQDTTVKFALAGDYNISLVDEANTGCSDSISKIITIVPNDSAAFTATDVCIGEATAFTNTSTFTSGGLTYKYYFDDNDSSILENPNHTYNNTGTHNDTLIVFFNSGQCSDTASNTNEVFVEPFIDFGGNVSGCDTYTLDAQNVGCTYLWSDGSTAQTLQVSSTGNYSVTITNANSCEYIDSVDVTIFISPTPNLGVDTSVCASLQLDAGYSGSSFQWSSGQSSQTINVTSTNNYSVTVTDANTCTGVDDINVSVNPIPVADFSVTDVCLNQICNFTNQSTITTGSIASYSWNFGDANNSSLENPTHTYGDDISYNIQLQIVSDSGCTDDITKSTSIRPLPIVGFSSSYLCDKQEITFNDTSKVVSPYLISSREWDFNDGQSSTAQNPSNNFASAGNYDIKLVATTSFGCRDSITKTISVETTDELSFTASDVCLGDTTQFDNTSTYSEPNLSWNWDFDDNSISSDSSSQHTYSSSGTYNVSLVVNYQNGQCYDTLIQSTNVLDRPVANLGTNTSSCGNYTLDAQNTGSTYLWSDGSSNQTLDVISSGDYSVTISVGSCQDIDTVNITINANPTPNLGNDTSVCGSYLLDAGYGGSSFQWSGGQTTQTVTATTSDIYAVTVTDQNGCDGSDTISVIVNPYPSASFTVVDVCLGENSIFTNASTVSSGTISTNNWNFGDGNYSNLQNSTHIFGNDGSYNIKLKITTDKGCSDSITQTTGIKPLPIVGFSSSYLCDKQEITFNDTSAVENPYSIASRQWNFDNGQSSAVKNPIINFATAGDYDIKLMATTSFGCRDSITKTLSVEHTDTLSFTASDVCLNDTTQFNNISTYSEANLSWSWNFGDNSISSDSSIQHIYSSAGNFDVSLVVNYHNGQCYDTLVKTTKVFDNPYISFGDTITTCGASYTLDAQNSGSTYQWNGNSTSQQFTATVDGDYSVTITNTNSCNFVDSVYIGLNTATSPDIGSDTSFCGEYQLDANYSGSTYRWSTGETTQTIDVNTSGLYKVTITDANGCTGSDSVNVQINPIPTASFSTQNSCLNLASDFQNTSIISSGTISSYLYDFGDNLTSNIENPSHSYLSPADYQVKLTITSDSGCVKDTIIIHTVYELPNAGFSTSTLCDNLEVSFQDTSTISNAYILTNYSWDFDNGMTAIAHDTTINYANTGSYTISHIATSNVGCSDTVVNTITVNPNDTISFTASDLCLNDTTFFSNTSSLSGAIQWTWDFDNGQISSLENPYEIYSAANTYQVKLLATYNGGQCVDSIINSVTMNSLPQINFADNIYTCDTNYVLDAQNDGATYVWSDNSTNKTLSITVAGTYSVKVSRNGCENSDTTTINFKTPVSINLGSDFSVCGSTSLDAGNPTASFNWNTGATSQNINIDTSGFYKVDVAATNGCTGSDSVNIQINPIPEASFSTQNSCLNVASSFQNTSTISFGSIISFLYDFGDNTSSIQANSTHSYISSGNYQVNLQITSDSGCVKDTTIIHTVYGIPSAGFSTSTLCDNLEVSFADTSTISNAWTITSWNWDFDNTMSSTTQNSTINFSDTGNYSISLIAISNMGCSDTVVNTLNIVPNDSVNFFMANICQNDTAFFNNTSTFSGIIQWAWNFGNGNTSLVENPKELYSGVGVFPIELRAIYNNGQCFDSLTKTLTVYSLPQIGFSDTTETCETSYSLNAGNAGSMYLWSNYSTNQILTTTNSGNYFVEVTDTNNCRNSDTTQLVFNISPIPNLGLDTSACGSYSLNAGIGDFYNWSNGDTTQQITINNTGNYWVEVTTLAGCTGSDTVNLQIFSLPTVSLGADIDTCNADSLLLTGGNYDKYIWNNNDTNSNIYVTQSGNYWIEITDNNGCNAADTIGITLRYLNQINLSDSMFICPGEDLVVNPNATGATVNWLGPNSFSQTADSVTITDVGTYYIEANLLTCTERDTFEVAISNMAMIAEFLSTSAAETQDSVLFIELSHPNPIQFQWDFDDGTTDTLEDPIHLFYLEQTYNVKLWVKNSECASEIIKPIEITDPTKAAGEPISDNKYKVEIPTPEFVKILDAMVFPNPNNGQFTLNVELSAPSVMQVAVFNITGGMIYLKEYEQRSKIHQRFNFNGLKQGYYFIVVKTLNDVRTLKVVIVR